MKHASTSANNVCVLYGSNNLTTVGSSLVDDNVASSDEESGVAQKVESSYGRAFEACDVEQFARTAWICVPESQHLEWPGEELVKVQELNVPAHMARRR